MPSFNQHAHSYHQHANVQERLARWACQAALAELVQYPIGATLELGAGTGHLSNILSRQFPQNYHASDLAANMIAQGKMRHPQLPWLEIDAWQPQHSPVDLLCSSSLMQWAEEPLAILRQQASLLRPAGLIFHAWFLQDTLQELHQLGIPHALQWRTLETWQNYYRQAGLTILNQGQTPYLAPYANARQLLQSLHATGTHSPGRIPPSRLRQIIRQYDSRFSKAQGVYATWQFGFILAQAQ